MRASIMAIVMGLAAAGAQAQPAHEEIVVFGASGPLKDRISAGERADVDVFASANMAHPQALVAAGKVAAGKAAAVQRFARNTLRALVSPKVNMTPESLVDRMLDPAIKRGTSTPKAGPSGDCAMAMFERVDQGRPGAFDALSAKALQLTGGPNSPPPPVGKNAYGVLVAEGQADIFIAYCTNALIAVAEQPGLKSVAVPDAINVGADYGVAVIGAAPAAQRFVAFLLRPSGQRILTRQAFAPG